MKDYSRYLTKKINKYFFHSYNSDRQIQIGEVLRYSTRQYVLVVRPGIESQGTARFIKYFNNVGLYGTLVSQKSERIAIITLRRQNPFYLGLVTLAQRRWSLCLRSERLGLNDHGCTIHSGTTHSGFMILRSVPQPITLHPDMYISASILRERVKS